MGLLFLLLPSTCFGLLSLAGSPSIAACLANLPLSLLSCGLWLRPVELGSFTPVVGGKAGMGGKVPVEVGILLLCTQPLLEWGFHWLHLGLRVFGLGPLAGTPGSPAGLPGGWMGFPFSNDQI